MVERSQERLLGDVLGRGRVARDPRAQGDDPGAIAADEHLARLHRLALEVAPDDVAVGQLPEPVGKPPSHHVPLIRRNERQILAAAARLCNESVASFTRSGE